MKSLIRRFIREEKAKLDEMTVKEAAGYIWQYFGLFIVGFIVIVWLLVWGISRLIAGPPDYSIFAVFANSTASAGNGSRIWQDFNDTTGFDKDGKKVEFSTNMYFDYNRNQARGNEYYNSFIALTDAGTLDLITMMPEQLAPLGQSGRLLDWNLESCGHLREKYADRLIWYEPPEGSEQTEPVPVGIDVSDSLLVSRYNVYPETCALGIGAKSSRLDAVEVFLDFIYSNED